jgi:transcriptional regulator with XRE-family HTH domain
MMLYNGAQQIIIEEGFSMPKKRIPSDEGAESFGDRLARLRNAAGYSLRELAQEVGISHIMLVHYEKHEGYPSAQVVPRLAKALHVSADQLLGIKTVKKNGSGPKGKMKRLFEEASDLPRNQQDKIAEFVSAFMNQYRQTHAR